MRVEGLAGRESRESLRVCSISCARTCIVFERAALLHLGRLVERLPLVVIVSQTPRSPFLQSFVTRTFVTKASFHPALPPRCHKLYETKPFKHLRAPADGRCLLWSPQLLLALPSWVQEHFRGCLNSSGRQSPKVGANLLACIGVIAPLIKLSLSSSELLMLGETLKETYLSLYPIDAYPLII